jgi:hypothetical protein
MDGFAQIPHEVKPPATQVLGVDADLLEQASVVLQRHAAHTGAWRSVPLLAAASLVTDAAAWLRQLELTGHDGTEPELPELLD